MALRTGGYVPWLGSSFTQTEWSGHRILLLVTSWGSMGIGTPTGLASTTPTGTGRVIRRSFPPTSPQRGADSWPICGPTGANPAAARRRLPAARWGTGRGRNGA